MSTPGPNSLLRRPEVLVSGLLILLLWSFAFPSLPLYNVTWDEALGDYFFGERYLSYFTSFDPAYLEFDADPYPPTHTPDLGLSPFRNRPWEYYPVANVLAAATSKVLASTVGLDPFDGYHALNLWLSAIFIAFWLPFLHRRYGLLAATTGTALLLTAPRVFGHLMANIKDFPLAVFFALTCIAFLAAYEAGSTRGLALAGVLWGLALGVKANALFLPGIVVAVVLLGRTPEPWRGQKPKLFGVLTLAGGLGVLTLLIAWPYLWGDPIGRALQHFEYIALRGNFTRPESFAPVLEAILLTTPLPLLALSVLGSILCLQRAIQERDRLSILWLAWVAVVLGRYLPPQAVNFDGVRHFLELFPALTALAGIALAWIVQQLSARLSRPSPKALSGVLLTLTLLPGTWSTLTSHPFQIAWWNSLTGGTSGAHARNLPQAGDYWGTSYRLGIEWLNQNAEPDSYLAVPVIEHAVRLVAPERLRDDIQLLPITSPLSPLIPPERLAGTIEIAGRAPVYVMFVERRDWMNPLMLDCLTRLEPEVVWELDNTPLLRIYRYTPPRGSVPFPATQP